MHRDRFGGPCGFTLLEIMTVLVVAGILLATALPAIDDVRGRSAAQTAARRLRADVARARARAILDGGTVRVVLDTLAAGYRVVDAGRTVLQQRVLPPGVAIRTTAHRQEILFSARGTSNLYSTTWIGVEDDVDARWHGLRVLPTGAVETR